MNKNRISQSGYTLIEVIIAVQIFLIVLTMTYTIFLFGYKFMGKWIDDNDLLATEILIQKSLANELITAKKIIELTEQSIVYLDKKYNIQNIHWTDDSLFIKSKPVNKPDVNINIQKIEFIISEKNKTFTKSFSELDLNKDNFLHGKELENISALKFDYILINNNNKVNSNSFIQVLK